MAFLPQSKQSLQNELNHEGHIVGRPADRLKHIRIYKSVSETCMMKNKSNVLHQNNRMGVNHNFMYATQAHIVNDQFWCHSDEKKIDRGGFKTFNEHVKNTRTLLNASHVWLWTSILRSNIGYVMGKILFAGKKRQLLSTFVKWYHYLWFLESEFCVSRWCPLDLDARFVYCANIKIGIESNNHETDNYILCPFS